MQRFRRFMPWFMGILIASLLFAILGGYTNFQYSGTDDTPILRSFMGYEGGEPAHFSLLVHTVMAWLLWGLAKLFPGVAWFSIFQLAFLWVSSVVIVKSMTQCAMRFKHPFWIGTLIGVLALAAGAVFITCRVSFTTTAAWLGAAAVAQLASVDWAGASDRAIRRGMGLCTLLLILCYSLRQVSVLPPLAFCMLGLLVVALTYFGKGEERRNWKPMLTGVVTCAVCLLALVGVRVIERQALNLDEFYSWQDASGQILDYSDLEHNTPSDAALAEIGWSREEYTLFTYWFFMDDNINPQNMTKLYNSTFKTEPASVGTHLSAAMQTVGSVLRDNPSEAWGFYMGLAAAALCLLLAVFTRRRKPWVWLGALAAPLLAGVLLGYLAWEGRLPMRALVNVTLPMITLCLWLLIASITPVSGKRLQNLLCLVLCAALFYPAYESARIAWYNARPAAITDDSEETPIEADLDTYALENPDTLFVYDLSLVCDMRLFPDTSAGIPGNLMFWGGHPSRSPSWYAMLKRYGITEMNGSTFLRDNVLLASTDPEPWPSFMAYVAASTGTSVDWEYVDSYGYLNFFRVYEN